MAARMPMMRQWQPRGELRAGTSMPRNVSPSRQVNEFALPGVTNFFGKSEVLISFPTRMNVERQVWCHARHNSRRELHSRHLRTCIFIFIAAVSVLFRATACAQSDLPNSDSSALD